jgi:hypothetical protein
MSLACGVRYQFAIELISSRPATINPIYTSVLAVSNRQSSVVLMNAISSILTTVAVLIHSVLGCCLHHSHGCEFGHEHVVSTHADKHGGHNHHHCHDDSHSDESTPADNHGDNHGDDHGDHEDCDEDNCSFISVLRNDVKSQLAAAPTWLPAPCSMICLPTLTMTHCSGIGSEGPPWLAASRPLHALTQVWLG